MTDFIPWARAIQTRTEAALDHLLPGSEITPQRLHQAMRYAVLGGGKRMRALLAHAAGEWCGATPQATDAAAVAVELIHAYSLVHDDLPSMDNDDLRRGKPSCHRQFDEATALLAGDALQSLAFQVLAQPAAGLDAPRQLENVRLLAQAAGSRGMAGGQAIDLASIGLSLDREELEFMHMHKTGALIRAAALLGARSAAQPEPRKLQAIDHYAKCLGLAFQVVDDVLDEQADSATLGKTAGKDAAQNKPTYATVLGLRQAQELAETLHTNAIAALAESGREAQRLRQIADFIIRRTH